MVALIAMFSAMRADTPRNGMSSSEFESTGTTAGSAGRRSNGDGGFRVACSVAVACAAVAFRKGDTIGPFAIRTFVFENVFPIRIDRRPIVMILLQELFFEPRIYARLRAWVCHTEGDLTFNSLYLTQFSDRLLQSVSIGGDRDLEPRSPLSNSSRSAPLAGKPSTRGQFGFPAETGAAPITGAPAAHCLKLIPPWSRELSGQRPETSWVRSGSRLHGSRRESESDIAAIKNRS